jgi:VanZ family protein
MYGLLLVVATHAPSAKVQFLVKAVDYGPLAPDKLLHMASYAVLGLLAVLAYGSRWRRPATGVIALFFMLAAWGVLDEATQPFFGRSADVIDWAYDVVGVVLGLAAGLVASRWLDRRAHSR